MVLIVRSGWPFFRTQAATFYPTVPLNALQPGFGGKTLSANQAEHFQNVAIPGSYQSRNEEKRSNLPTNRVWKPYCLKPGMNTRGRRIAQSPSRTANAFPVVQVCEICCLVVCRVLVPKLADQFDLQDSSRN